MGVAVAAVGFVGGGAYVSDIPVGEEFLEGVGVEGAGVYAGLVPENLHVLV